MSIKGSIDAPRIKRARMLYVVLSLCLAGIASSISRGESEALVPTPIITTCIFALACGSCLLASVNPLRYYFWVSSGWLTAVATIWRILTLAVVAVRDGELYERSLRFAVTVISLWMLTLVGVWALWAHPLRPERDCE